ncbi:MAG: PEP-CTERM sorting domain-containing protein [Phycisphaerales bacterium]
MRSISFSVAVTVALVAGSAASAETIVLRSGQSSGVPGTAGQLDDTVRYLANNPPGAPISAFPFTPGDFSGADTGPAAVVINPYTPFWTPGISDPLARWINFRAEGQVLPDGTFGGSGYGSPGSCLFAVPFYVNTIGATGGFLNMEFAVDDGGGDFNWGGPNPAFLYVNGVSTGYTGGNYASSTFHSQFISFSQGWNTIYLYQRDQGVAVSGTIFSITIDVVPAPGAAAALGLGGLGAMRRRRRLNR